MIKRCMRILILATVLALLTACGSSSGGGGGTPPPPAGGSNWDEMVWDQDDWA